MFSNTLWKWGNDRTFSQILSSPPRRCHPNASKSIAGAGPCGGIFRRLPLGPLMQEHLYLHPAIASQNVPSAAPLKVTKITFCCPTTRDAQHVLEVPYKHPVFLWPACLSRTRSELDATQSSLSWCLLTSSAKACLTLPGRLLCQIFLRQMTQNLSAAKLDYFLLKLFNHMEKICIAVEFFLFHFDFWLL